MANTYPVYLPILEQAKSEFTQPTRVEGAVMAGPPFTEVLTEDAPTTWQGRVQFSSGQYRVFLAWLNQSVIDDASPLNGGWFDIDVKTAFGLQNQTVKFIGDAPQSASMQGNVWVITVNILTRSINYGVDISDGSEDAADILELAEISPDGDVVTGAKLVDLAVNVDLNELN